MPKLKLKCPLEAAEARAFWDWAQYHPIARDHLSHNQNEGKKSWAHGKQKKAEGTRKGVSDYFLAYPNKGKSGLWIELKRRDKGISRLTEEQAIWLVRMEKAGYATAVAYGADDAVQKVMEYLK